MFDTVLKYFVKLQRDSWNQWPCDAGVIWLCGDLFCGNVYEFAWIIQNIGFL